MNKKGGLLSFLIGLMSIVVYVSLFMALITQRQNISSEIILAEHAMKIQDLEEEHQRVNMFLDEAARLSAEGAFSSIGQVENCGSYEEVPYWKGKKNKETLTYCIGEAKELIRQSMRDNFLEHIQRYPNTKVIIPRTYDIMFISKDELEIIGTPLAPLNIEDSMITYPGFRVRTSNHLNEVQELIDFSSALIDECIGKELDSCVGNYIQEVNRQAMANEKLLVNYGKSCGSDKSGDRSVVLCKDMSFGKIKFALYIPSDIPLQIVRLEVQALDIKQDWLKKGQNLIVNPEDEIFIRGTITAPQETTIEWCEWENCIVLEQTGTENRRNIGHRFNPGDEERYYLKVTMQDEEIRSPVNNIFIS